MSISKIQKRLVTFEIITKGDRPLDIDDIAQDVLTTNFHNSVAGAVNLRYEKSNGGWTNHDFIGVTIKEIK